MELARNPQAALSGLVHNMELRVLRDGLTDTLPLGVTLRLQDRLETHAPDLPQSPAATAMEELQRSWVALLPENVGELFATLLAMSQDELVRLLAICVARTVDVVSGNETERCSRALELAVALDMKAWWTATAEGYFTHVSKAVILEGVQQFAPAEVTRLSKLKKADLASEAERLASGTGWLPGMLRAHEPLVVDGVAPGNAPQDEAVWHRADRVR